MLKKLLKWSPLVRYCQFGELHWWYEEICDHGYGVVDPDTDWYGGISLLKAEEMEMHPYRHMSNDESSLLEAWQLWRDHVLGKYGPQLPYHCKVYVRLGPYRLELISMTQGLACLNDKDARDEQEVSFDN